MSYRNHIYSARRLWCIVNSVDHSGSGQEQDNDDQNWNDRPCQLYLRTSVDLSRLAAGLDRAPTELNDGIDQ